MNASHHKKLIIGGHNDLPLLEINQCTRGYTQGKLQSSKSREIQLLQRTQTLILQTYTLITKCSILFNMLRFTALHITIIMFVFPFLAEAQSSPYDQQVEGTEESLHFTVVDIHRPHMREGKTLNAPRYIYLQASREPTKSEARRLTPSEKRALKSRRLTKKSKRGSSRTPKANQSSLDQTWEGRLLKASRLGPPRERSYSERYVNALRRYEEKIITEKRASLAALAEAGSPIALSSPIAPANLLESSDDDDEMSGSEDGEICGHLGEQCCITQESPLCDTGLDCVKNRCLNPPKPCGGFEQSCCDEGLACRRAPLRCLADQSGQRCLLPPLPPERLKTPIGILEITEVQGRLIKAIVKYDALNPQIDDQPLNAIRRGDEAKWYRQ